MSCGCCGGKGHSKQSCQHLKKACRRCGEEGRLGAICNKSVLAAHPPPPPRSAPPALSRASAPTVLPSPAALSRTGRPSFISMPITFSTFDRSTPSRLGAACPPAASAASPSGASLASCHQLLQLLRVCPLSNTLEVLLDRSCPNTLVPHRGAPCPPPRPST